MNKLPNLLLMIWLGHFSIFQMFLGLQKNPKKVSKLELFDSKRCRFPHQSVDDCLSLFWRNLIYSVSAIYLVHNFKRDVKCSVVILVSVTHPTLNLAEGWAWARALQNPKRDECCLNLILVSVTHPTLSFAEKSNNSASK